MHSFLVLEYLAPLFNCVWEYVVAQNPRLAPHLPLSPVQLRTWTVSGGALDLPGLVGMENILKSSKNIAKICKCCLT